MPPTKDVIQAIYNRTPCFGEYGNVSLQRVIIAMNPTDNNKNQSETFKASRVKPRYINIRENIYEALSNDAMAVYIALRFEADYSTEVSPVEKNIQFLCNKAKIKKTRCKECLSELEQNGLTKIQLNPGYQSTYMVADELGHFLPKEVPEVEQPPVDQPSRKTTDPSRTATDPSRQTTDINTNLFTNSSSLKPYVDFQSTESYRDDELFMRFYSIYPNKQKPEVARKAFYKHKPTAEFVSMLCTDVYKRVENNWKNRHKNKIPFPATYLNGKEWQGEIVEPESTDSRLSVKSTSRPVYDDNDTSWMNDVRMNP